MFLSLWLAEPLPVCFLPAHIGGEARYSTEALDVVCILPAEVDCLVWVQERTRQFQVWSKSAMQDRLAPLKNLVQLHTYQGEEVSKIRDLRRKGQLGLALGTGTA